MIIARVLEKGFVCQEDPAAFDVTLAAGMVQGDLCKAGLPKSIFIREVQSIRIDRDHVGANISNKDLWISPRVLDHVGHVAGDTVHTQPGVILYLLEACGLGVAFHAAGNITPGLLFGLRCAAVGIMAGNAV